MKLGVHSVLLVLVVRSEIQKCGTNGAFYAKFLATTQGIIKPGETTQIKGRCFRNLQLILSETDSFFNMRLQGDFKEMWWCNDFVFLSTGRSNDFVHMKWNIEYEHKFMKADMSSLEIGHVRTRGIRVMLPCVRMVDMPVSFVITMMAFFGGLGTNPDTPIFGSKVPEYMLKANLEWTSVMTSHNYERIADSSIIVIDKKDIKSGTLIGTHRFDMVNTIIELGSGSRVGHTAMTIWHDEELYVIESKTIWYWPVKGIQINKWEDWLRMADNGDMNVILLPLKGEFQEKFDEQKAWDWFQQLKGLDYGYQNFLFGLIDTIDKNTPEFMDLNFIAMILSVVEKFSPHAVKTIMIEAINMRLGSNAQNMPEVWEELYRHGLSLEEVLSTVEKEGWQYSSGSSYTCSAFVTSVYKKAGLFGDLEIESTEFTPKDVYELEFFDLTGTKVPESCQHRAEQGFCQIMGKVKIVLGKASFVKPYSNMNEKCPSMAPLYERKDGC